MADPATVRIAVLGPADYEAAIPGLAGLLVDAVDSGAGVNFLAGLDEATAAAWWRDRIAAVADGTISPVVARDGTRVVGSVLLIRSRNPNSPHRAEIGKVLVLQSERRRGIATRLMETAETAARGVFLMLRLLATSSCSPAEAMYRSLGWHAYGVVPNHALLTDGTPATTTFFWKDLR